MPKQSLFALALAIPIIFLGCSKPSSLPANGAVENFDFSQSTPFRWGMNKREVTLFLPPDKFDEAWNSKRTQASFAKFGDVQYLLFFNFTDDVLIRTDIILLKTTNFHQTLEKVYDVYKYLQSINVPFPVEYLNLDKKTFINLAKRKSYFEPAKKYVFEPITTLSLKNKFIIYISTEPEKNEYEVVLQISRT